MSSKRISPLIVATLHVPEIITKAKSWLGWNVVFADSVKHGDILEYIPFIELALNEYLEKNVDVISNHLIVPFTCKMRATFNPPVYTFKIKVYVRAKLIRRRVFNYPSEPVNRINGYILQKSSPTTSHINTVSIKPPPN